MKDECLICGKPLEYLPSAIEMECAVCHQKEHSAARCTAGHYVCNACHMRGMDAMMGACLRHTSRNPMTILRTLMALPFCHMHGPEHHTLVGAALLTAYKNSGGEIDLSHALKEMYARGQKVPGGACGYWGACGAAISSGMFVSIVTGATPLGGRKWGLCNLMTSSSLQAIGDVGGPRCCKRNSALAITQAVRFAKEYLGVEMELEPITCVHSAQNNQCIGKRCPFYP